MARNKEVSLLLLDVGPSMHSSLEYAEKALSGYIHAKMLNKPSHEVALIYFGTSDTSNQLNTEMAASGDDDQYQFITYDQELRPPDMSFMTSLSSIAPGDGKPDFIDALTVAADSLFRTLADRPILDKANIAKRIILISDFATPAKDDPGDDFVPTLMEKLAEKDVVLEVNCLDTALQESTQNHSRDANLQVLHRVLSAVRHTVKRLRSETEILGVFKAKEYSHTAYFTGEFRLSNAMHIKVKVCKKSSQERPLAVSKYSDRGHAPNSSHAILTDTEYKSSTDPDKIVPAENRVKAYKYGKQNVPLPAQDEGILKFSPDKGLWLLGFVETQQVPRHTFMKDVWLVAADKTTEKSLVAMSALSRALQARNTVAIVRFVPRASGAVVMGACTPLLGNGRQPDCLLLNHLPFFEDMRSFTFASFASRPEAQPTPAQLSATDDLIDSMQLVQGDEEQLKPDETVNPTLNRFYAFMAARVVDPNAAAPELDPLTSRIMLPHLDTLPRARAALAAAKEAFPIKLSAAEKAAADAENRDQGDEPAENGQAGTSGQEEEKKDEGPRFNLDAAPTTQAETVGSSSPVEDFESLVQQGRPDIAFNGLARIIETLVARSLGDRSFGKALSCLQALRQGCIQHSRPQLFNDTLTLLTSKWDSQPNCKAFWIKVHDASLQQISSQEETSSPVSPREAEAWFKSHAPEQKVEEEQPKPEPMEEDQDEFADMD
ncbi:hypothetical protein WJX74_009567 [Apatococcus lobatus]|uniref:Ku domain-containing protein n=1 Tax=Apatococcus lobatus TaxID=904363 RepID=A0AAW1S2T3_9CHLO